MIRNEFLSVRGLPTESIETILTLEMRCKPHFQNKNVLTSYMTSSIRHQFFEFFQGDRPDFPLSNFRKKIILVLSLLSSFRSGLCTKYLKILMRPNELYLLQFIHELYLLQFVHELYLLQFVHELYLLQFVHELYLLQFIHELYLLQFVHELYLLQFIHEQFIHYSLYIIVYTLQFMHKLSRCEVV